MDSRQFDKFCREAGYIDSKHGAIETWEVLTFGLTGWVFLLLYPGYVVGAGDKAFRNSHLIEIVDWSAGMFEYLSRS